MYSKTLWESRTVQLKDWPERKPISYKLRGYFVGWGVELAKPR